MNSRSYTAAGGLLAVAVLACVSPSAHAFTLRALVQTIRQQEGFASGVYLGHIVIANSSMNRLIAGGAFEARCPSSYTGTINDQRTLSASALIGGTQLYVTIPEWLPALRPMPGFENVPGGTTLMCSYNWTAHAEEATFTVGVPGFNMTIGGERGSDGRSVPFEMYKPGSSDEDNNGCIR
jgi:hypothetical protein